MFFVRRDKQKNSKRNITTVSQIQFFIVHVGLKTSFIKNGQEKKNKTDKTCRTKLNKYMSLSVDNFSR